MELNVTELSVARGGVPVLEGVSLSLAPGQALVLRGPNGSGKTTLLRTIAGLQPALAGNVTGAEDRIAYAGHADGLKAMLSVSENLNFWAAVFGTRHMDAALAAFALEPLADRLAGTLSAGQKRRLGLARLLVTGRPIWVLDEPTVSLDADAVTLFADAVRAHLAGGGMALIATHIDLGLEAAVLDVTPHRVVLDAARLGASDEAFL
ncbi:heme ABC exporter ATP-binding protein CcmA [Pseudosulfitobacter pseudonitzschiae]|uniref:heme ABC exporter ATP-binding protein CcmA n=1 Tax=Pseudosulfitobacter pseudonitzschiae TaxID=1402135 RepID=UPI001AFCC09A|nr:heme ABC exporter ATP-binding protein CcmA [Pseudosulfitobacter pseudonitzschiae]MBM1813544.1 heme ABC exporter ATP-binding protein CcmA [Pseudosulfitobacter pseudonitzschiae]MBM1830537.1 heme ABC exporter ATP-binding protein CcmA [Pseudosulfitobacter pseudonitzschiae]MBM1835404.1 heme ABC exporter ATP-binding protein CcmA [Pseudosulfitobacter pseudonitzschiae]MBM1840250.1 heme ABC exporter ATP-binding protein CcmA [Pseudosulfitobacter pseudonitzschiae]MBM1845762.1 heme ABC exporter ATP-bin